jgi:hypothetical protein
MLFKVVDHNNKFIQYASLCISEEDLKNSIFFNSNISPKLKAIKSGIFSSLINCSFNQYTYKVAAIKIECYIENAFHPYYLDEIVSSKRAAEINSSQQNSWTTNSWQSSTYPEWSASTTAANTITYTFTYTPTTTTTNTVRVGDGYYIWNAAQQ